MLLERNTQSLLCIRDVLADLSLCANVCFNWFLLDSQQQLPILKFLSAFIPSFIVTKPLYDLKCFIFMLKSNDILIKETTLQVVDFKAKADFEST